jgi:2-polyprenyl-3-methyl-5-hydroxy-6-metoxy-1,4-benzoquinol methylase
VVALRGLQAYSPALTKCDWQVQRRLISRAFDCTAFENKKVLDIGCWDGLWSFEAERRGAREAESDTALKAFTTYRPSSR